MADGSNDVAEVMRGIVEEHSAPSWRVDVDRVTRRHRSTFGLPRPDLRHLVAAIVAAAVVLAGVDVATHAVGGPSGPRRASDLRVAASSSTVVRHNGSEPSTTTPGPTSTTSSAPPSTTAPPATTPPPLPTITMGPFTGVKPTTMILSADAGNEVKAITWSAWGQQSATGSGTWGHNDCTPNCALGTMTPYPATIVLSDPVNGQFTRLTETTSGPYGSTQTFTLPTQWYWAS